MTNFNGGPTFEETNLVGEKPRPGSEGNGAACLKTLEQIEPGNTKCTIGGCPVKACTTIVEDVAGDYTFPETVYYLPNSCVLKPVDPVASLEV